eukprot:2025541-Pyramimonas_sp.AAC.1
MRGDLQGSRVRSGRRSAGRPAWAEKKFWSSGSRSGSEFASVWRGARLKVCKGLEEDLSEDLQGDPGGDQQGSRERSGGKSG